MAADYLRFLPEYIPITKNGQWSPGDKCNAVTFFNYGTAPVTIDNFIILQQGQQFGIPGELGEAFGNYQFNISFGAVGTIDLVVVKKVYL